MTQKELDIVLRKHKAWLSNEPGRERADLRGADLRRVDLREANLCEADLCRADLREANLCEADLREANLRGADLCRADLREADLCRADLREANLCEADLREANLCRADLDFSCWPLWCGSLDTVVDRRIAAQIAYHFCSLVCDDPGYIKARNAILNFANEFHRVGECGYLEPIEGKEGS